MKCKAIKEETTKGFIKGFSHVTCTFIIVTLTV